MYLPSTRSASCSSGFGVTFSIANSGASPSTFMSARFVSPSRSNASSRIVSTRSDRLRSLATVKSHAR